MNVLTDDECRDIYNAAMEAPDRSAVSVTRTIAAAVIKRLAAGVSVEPAAWIKHENGMNHMTSSFQIAQADGQYQELATANSCEVALAAARVQENERCAKFFDENDTVLFWGSSAAKRVRALLGKEPT